MSALEVEAHVRDVVADHLGVDAGQLGREVSLTDDLAADSLDLAEIAIAIEGSLGLVLPQRFLDEVRTCGDLVDGVLALARRGVAAEPERPPFVRARITGGGRRPPWSLERALALTPYAAESISEDALLAGPGARLEITLAGDGPRSVVAQVRRVFAPLGGRGVRVAVRWVPRRRRAA